MHIIESNSLKDLCAHFVGNKLKENGIELTDKLVDITNIENYNLINEYLLGGFKNNYIYYNFHNVTELKLNDIYTIVSNIFESPKLLLKHSKSIAKFLYENSTHPQIKDGELYVAYITGCLLNDEIVDAVGIFKSETKSPFLKIVKSNQSIEIKHDEGIDIKKLDKGCLIFNTDIEKGYKVCLIDNSNKYSEAQYWKDNFLNLKPCADSYHQTKDYLTLTKDFVLHGMNEDFEISKADQANFLNLSIDYFKKHEVFNEKEFSRDVFSDTNVIKSFKNYKDEFQVENEIEIVNDFHISPQALKKQSRVFKSVLKLDKNFHIYIHGNRELIEQGTEKDGRKFYKIYFEKES